MRTLLLIMLATIVTVVLGYGVVVMIATGTRASPHHPANYDVSSRCVQVRTLVSRVGRAHAIQLARVNGFTEAHIQYIARRCGI